MKTATLILSLVALSSCTLVGETASPATQPQAGFVELFNGKDLKGWVQHGGKATYTIVDGAIVGTTVNTGTNSFLCTEKNYGDFEFECDVKVADGINSGIQFRSNVKVLNKETDRVWGYQHELDPSSRAWTSGIYEEAGRGWLMPKKGDAASEADWKKRTAGTYKNNEWNHVRIVCQGDHIQTFLNGKAMSDIRDSNTASGFIALQVHGIDTKKPENVGKTISWKNLRIRELTAK